MLQAKWEQTVTSHSKKSNWISLFFPVFFFFSASSRPKKKRQKTKKKQKAKKKNKEKNNKHKKCESIKKTEKPLWLAFLRIVTNDYHTARVKKRQNYLASVCRWACWPHLLRRRRTRQSGLVRVFYSNRPIFAWADCKVSVRCPVVRRPRQQSVCEHEACSDFSANSAGLLLRAPYTGLGVGSSQV